MVSLGGAIGGLFVALIAPRIFPNYWEMPIAIAGLGVLIAIVLFNDDDGVPRPMAVRVSLLIVALSFGVYLARLERRANQEYMLAARNFYGVLRVRDDPPDGGVNAVRVLIHGTINHGTELMSPGGGRIPTSYFGETSGISRAIRSKGERGPIRIGILGLGAGVTATLARAGDTLHYYEINPLIFQIAQTKFDFWKDCPADKHLYFGDGRLTLEGMKDSENLDFLAMDAFTSDAVPMHLLTLEAYATYARHMKPDGILAVNISNRYLDLEPIMAQAAKQMGWTGVIVYDEGNSESYYVSNTWVLLSKSPAVFNHPNFQDGSTTALQVRQEKRVWTDDYSNILQILR
jgi:spermidine synthase